MNTLHNTLLDLKYKKALLITEMESLPVINYDKFYSLGKIQFEIHKTERQIVRETVNDLE